MRLSEYRANEYSQNGEDGVLAKLFETLGVSLGYFVEFGAWDGRKLSNTYALFEKGWHGCYIEGDEIRFRALCRNVADPSVSKVCRFVSVTGPDSLDVILDGIGAPLQFDLLSIDIDSDDLAVWRSVQRHRAKCVVIEHNYTIPFDCEFENPPGRSWGNSALSIVRFAGTIRYALVCVTDTNLVFVEESVLQDTAIQEIALSDALQGPRWFWGYDGALLCKTGREDRPEKVERELYWVPWTRALGIQPIPKPLRGYRDGASAIGLVRRSLGIIVAVCFRPSSTVRGILHRLESRKTKSDSARTGNVRA
jgi:hypothetical protein